MKQYCAYGLSLVANLSRHARHVCPFCNVATAGAHTDCVGVQVERMERDLKTGAVSGSGGRAAGGDAPPTPTRKLGKAIGDENERFLSGQSQQQQQIIRRALALLSSHVKTLSTCASSSCASRVAAAAAAAAAAAGHQRARGSGMRLRG